ncbi:hydrogenase iron-sulfur subunit [Candidatus Sumerlaeota bacterium]|nr:hydrogenase iron-sulfur subunit [Candidatus Sumerlaeota bacterium]
MSESPFVPTIVGFFCKWCSYTAADLAGVSRSTCPPTVRIIRVMCSSRVDPLMVVTALLSGADGVMIAGCHPGECHYRTGNYQTRRRFAMLESILGSLGLDTERLRISWIAASEGHRVGEVISRLTNSIQQIGPNSARQAMFL